MGEWVATSDNATAHHHIHPSYDSEIIADIFLS